jgi:hypothetical protein
MKKILIAIVLSAFAGIAGASQLGGSDLGATAPTPGFYDISQLLTTGDTIALQDGSLNYFYDNTSGGAGYVGSSFTTGANSSGYVMNSLALKFGGGQPVGYAGGADTSLNPGWIITIYKLSGTGNTTATPVYTNTVGALSGTANSGADWIQITGFNLPLQGNAVYAWTILSSGYDDLAYSTGTPYSGGAICRIPPGGGTVTYFPSDADSATFNVGLSQVSPVLGGTDFGSTVPSVGANDVAQLLTTGDTTALTDSGSINRFYDNTANSAGYVGSSFTTGGNAGGYVMNGLVLKFGGGQPVGYAGGVDTTLNPGWIITIYQLSGAGNTTATPIATNTVGTLAGSGNTGGDWIQLTGFDLPLLGSTTYAWTILSSGYDDLGYATGTPYSGGAICQIPPGGGTVSYYPADAVSATFAVNLSLRGFPAVGIISAGPNPAYALSPVTLSDTASGPGPITYKWQTNTDLTGGLGGTWVDVGGATATNLVVVPPNSGSSYTIDYQFIASNPAGSVTSAPVALVVNPASAPIITTDIAPTQVTTYVGGSASFSAYFTGTLPLTNDWQANTTGSYVDLSGQTNSTINLTNVQLSAAGTYRLLEKNSQGSTPSSAATLTVLSDPAGPTSSEPEAFQIHNDGPYAYWRLNETADPSASIVQAYDYSGHGYFATYGSAATDGNAGPQSPAFPGFSSGELAAGTVANTAGSFLTVPPLNLNTNTVTFAAWIYPIGTQEPSAGLLFDRNGGDAAGFGFNTVGGVTQLGYTWNQNAGSTYGWASGLIPPANQWSFVAYVITPTNATVYLGLSASNNLLVAVNRGANQNEAFSNSCDLGSDPQGASRNFYGSIAEAAVWNRSLSGNEVATLYATGLGFSGIAPAPPATLPSETVFQGTQVQYVGTAVGIPSVSYQWKASPSQSVTGNPDVFTNVPNSGDYSGANTAILTINNVSTNDALDYEVVAANSIATNTSGIGTLTVTPVPAGGQWTMNFQLTNDTLSFATSTSGGGRYTGNGVLGSGTYWNTFVNTAGAFGAGPFNTATDFRDDGVTHSGIFATVNGSDDSTLGSTPASSDISALLQQFVYGATALTFTGVPDGIYNLVIYSCDGAFNNGGSILTVNAANGVQGPIYTAYTPSTYFSQGGNTELFTNVQVSGGTLLVNIGVNSSADNPGNHYDATFNGAQLQLVSYSTSISGISLGSVYSNGSLTLTWTEGALQTATNITGPWTDIVDPSPITVSTTNQSQFFRLKIK